MNRESNYLNSTIGKKLVMSATGLLLVMFLIVHLIENILIFESADAFNEWAHFLTDTLYPYILIAEFGLAALFIVHVVSAIQLRKVNLDARPQGYYGFGRAGHTSRKTPLSSNMIRTGFLIIGFVVFHLLGFKFGTHYETETGIRDMHRLVLEAFGQFWIASLYVILMMVLGLHLVHGIHSAFQTLGIPHRTGLMRFSQGLAVALAAGFAMMPIIVHFMGDKLA